jgi:hypothetical protein
MMKRDLFGSTSRLELKLAGVSGLESNEVVDLLPDGGCEKYVTLDEETLTEDDANGDAELGGRIWILVLPRPGLETMLFGVGGGFFSVNDDVE